MRNAVPDLSLLPGTWMPKSHYFNLCHAQQLHNKSDTKAILPSSMKSHLSWSPIPPPQDKDQRRIDEGSSGASLGFPRGAKMA